MQRAADRVDEVVGQERLLDEVVRRVGGGLAQRVVRQVAAHQHDRDVGRHRPQHHEHLVPRQIRHGQVEHHTVDGGVAAGEHADRLTAARDSDHLEPGATQDDAHHLAHLIVVVDHQDGRPAVQPVVGRHRRLEVGQGSGG